MSTKASPFTTGLDVDGEAVGAALRHAVVDPLQALSFWTAVLLPLAYLPLVADGLGSGETSVLLALVAVNAAALVLGHGHAR
ncbi:MAG: hypothetical protein V5A31_09305 [Haloferacaceae archaeon]|jgi:hypothetical protein